MLRISTVIQKIDALLKSDRAQSGAPDDVRVFYNRTDKSLRLTGTPQRLIDAKHIVLEGIESLASDTEAQARKELWSKHVVPDSSLQPPETTTDPASAVMGNEAKVPIIEDTKLKAFVLHEDADDGLIKAWHDAVLPALDGLLSTTSDPSVVVTLQREGPNEVESRAAIRVCSSMLMSEVEKDRLKDSLLSLLPDRLRSRCRVEFSRGSIRRTGNATRAVANGKYNPPICAPRNRRWLHKPTMGASIGRRGSQDDTATLGGYVLVDGIAHILTVHHLFEEEKDLAYNSGRLRKGQYRVTQPSEQDIRDIDVEILSLRNSIGRFEAEQTTLMEWMAQLKELEKLQSWIPKDERLWQFGEVVASSGYRNRVPRKAPNSQSLFGSGPRLPIEMDWAICSVLEERVGLNEIGLPETYPQDPTPSTPPSIDRARQRTANTVKQCTKTSEPASGVAVHSLGRTSHYQTGVVSPCGTYTRQRLSSGGFRSSVEWTIMRHASKSLADWSEGGMGVDGDSGSWIVREDNNALMGMLWGRLQNEDVADPIALFTPIQDIFADIIDTIRPTSLDLPQGTQAQPFSFESLSPHGLDLRSSNKRKTQPMMLPPSKRRDGDSLAPPHRCRKCCPPPSIQLQATPPGTPNSGGWHSGSPPKTCDCALEISPPVTPAQ